MDSSDQFRQLLREYSRQMCREIWQAGQAGEPQAGEAAGLYQAMLDHPEHAALWARLDEASEDEVIQDGVSLPLHLTFHGIIENQLAAGEPQAIRPVLEQLIHRGLSRHEAVHCLANALVAEMVQMMHTNRPYQEQRYVRALRKLPSQVKAGPRKKR